MTLATALVAFFLIYASEFVYTAPTIPFDRLPEAHPDHATAELPATHGIASFLVTTGVLAVPLLLVWKRGSFPRGLVTMLVATVSVLSASIVGFDNTVVVGAAGAVLGAAVAEALVPSIQRHLANASYWSGMALAGTVTASIWSGHTAALAVSSGLAWPIELWAGAIVLSAMSAAGLALLSAQPAR